MVRNSTGDLLDWVLTKELTDLLLCNVDCMVKVCYEIFYIYFKETVSTK